MPNSSAQGSGFLNAVREGSRSGRLTVCNPGLEGEAEWGELVAGAEGRISSLRAQGIGPGDRVALEGEPSLQLVETLLSIWFAGCSVIVLPARSRRATGEASGRRAVAWLRDAGVSVLIRCCGASVSGAGDVEHIVSTAEPSTRLPRRSDDSASSDLVLLQPTSGTTGQSRIVPIYGDALVSHVRAIAARASLSSGDRWVSWLPLFHDMGMIGFLVLPLLVGGSLWLSSPGQFARDPRSWLRTISVSRATVTGAPNFAYGLAAKLFHNESSFDLRSLQVAFNGAEHIVGGDVRAFLEVGERWGFDAAAMYCVYGMAEATLAVTFPDRGVPPQFDVVDRRSMETNQRAVPIVRGSSALEYALVGRPLPGLRLRIVDAVSRKQVGLRRVGEIEITGEGVMAAYLGEAPPAIDRAWFRTGDLGYLTGGGDLAVCGRTKDVIILAGRNISPMEIEAAVGEVAGVRAGNVAAFGISGGHREELVVLAEVAENNGRSLLSLRRAVGAAVREAVGNAPSQIVLLEPRTIPKTTSGKLQRNNCRARYCAGTLRPLS